MQYDTVRDKLKDGQIAFIEAVTLKQKLICWITNGRFSHVGIITWMTDARGNKKLMCIESDIGDVRMVQLRSYLPRGMTIVDIGLDWRKCANAAIDSTGVIHYSLTDLIFIGMKSILLRFGLNALAKMIPNDRGGKVCSEFVASILAQAGYDLDTFTSPNELFDALNALPQHRRNIPIDAQTDDDAHK